jgi:hypothetical protein
MRISRAILASACLAASLDAAAIGTAFTYQGSLEELGQPANGSYDFRFQLASAADVAITGPLVVEDVSVVGGVFTVQLDFGAGLFSGADRRLQIAVRPGPSADPFTPLTPSTPIQPSPYAQRASGADLALTANSANDVLNGSIDEVDLATSAVSTRTIEANAVTSAKIDDGTVVAADIANNTLTFAKFAGVNGVYGISANVGANNCNDYDVSFGGDVDVGDAPILVMDAGTQLTEDMSVTALRVLAANTVEIRICNFANATQNTGALNVRLITLR